MNNFNGYNNLGYPAQNVNPSIITVPINDPSQVNNYMEMIDMYNDYLAHHGVLGMKWGVRRYQPYGEGGYTPKDKNREVIEKRKQMVRDVRTLSTEELGREITRLEKEKKFKELVYEDVYGSGQAAVRDQMRQKGAQVLATAVIGTAAGIGVVALRHKAPALLTTVEAVSPIAKELSNEIAARAFPKPKK